ncbi:uncharacterized protein LOC143656882 [Tamandua tetradactyla]|uniref:uncharacterized protein LOC143656882 n=1 Tax=Tamandua tetradactyla TaxID=48850 RepID=UPI0040549E33
MPRAKEGKGKTKGAPLPITPILQKFLKTYEKHCAQSQTSVCPAIRRDLKASINGEQVLRKFILVRPADSSPSLPPVSLEPLLMTIHDECYTQGRELCLCGLQLSNPEVARLALLLELKGRTTYPFATLEIIDCKMDLWSLGRLGEAVQFSHLHSLVLDYCKLGNEEIQRILCGLEKSPGLRALSLRYCGLGPPSGQRLAAVLGPRAVRELRLDGNYLQCPGARALLGPMAQDAERQGRPATPPPGPPRAPQLPPGRCGQRALNCYRGPSAEERWPCG